jgi:hypothetical protein
MPNNASILIESIPPVVIINSPANNSNQLSLPFDINVSTDKNAVCWYEFSNGASGSVTTSYSKEHTGPVSSMQDGTFTLTVYCNETYGKTGQDSITVNIDTKVPFVIIHSPVSTAVYGSANMMLNVSTDETSSCNYTLNSDPEAVLFTNSMQDSTTITAQHGNNTLSMSCVDMFGRINNTESVIFETDLEAPANISDLSAVPTLTTGEIRLTWTASGDDNMTGSAASYTIKQSNSPINNMTDFSLASAVSQSITPKSAGTAESFTVTGLTTGQTYYFAIIATDDVGHNSSFVNYASGMPVTHDIGIDSIAQSKEGRTVYLYDNITITANITNYGSVNEADVPVKLIIDDNYASPVEIQHKSINVGETAQVSFVWNALQNGPVDNRKIEVYADLSGDYSSNNNKKENYVKVYDLDDLITLRWKSATAWPIPSSSGNEINNPFRVYVDLVTDASSPAYVYDLPVTLEVSGLAINSVRYPVTSQAGSLLDASSANSFTALYDTIQAGGLTESYWWKLNAAPGTYTISVHIGNEGNMQTITKEITI